MNVQQIKEFKNFIESHKQQAIQNPDKIHRIYPGWYFVYLNSELVEISQNESPDNEWIAKTDSWYSDPYSTLKELKNRLGILC